MVPMYLRRLSSEEISIGFYVYVALSLRQVCFYNRQPEIRRLEDSGGLKEKPARRFMFFQVPEAQPHRRDRI